MFQLLYFIVKALQPYLAPICLLCAWGLVAIAAWSLLSMLRDGVAKVKHLHKIPCANCRYFTGDYHLKCTVRPSTALSEDAINCADYTARENPFTVSQTLN